LLKPDVGARVRQQQGCQKKYHDLHSHSREFAVGNSSVGSQHAWRTPLGPQNCGWKTGPYLILNSCTRPRTDIGT